MEKLKTFILRYRTEIVLAGAVMLISVISFNLGRFEASHELQESVRLYQNGELSAQIGEPVFKVVGSVNSDKYHFEWCPGAERIKEENKIIFENEEAALAAGYTLAGNCSK